jgi:hypothetical protein
VKWKAINLLTVLLPNPRIGFLPIIYLLISGVFSIAPLFKPIIALCEDWKKIIEYLDKYPCRDWIALAITAGILGVQHRSRIPAQTKFMSKIIDL